MPRIAPGKVSWVMQPRGLYTGAMYKVLSLTKRTNSDPQEYELRLHDSENKKPGYVMSTENGTEEQVRAMLKNGGLGDAQIDLYFARAG